MMVADHVLSVIEKTLRKSSCGIPLEFYIAKHFPVATTGLRSWSHEDTFLKEPVRRMIMALATNQAHLANN